MAKIIGGIGTSHVPSVGVVYDQGRTEEPAWKPLFDGYKPVQKWIKENEVDVAVVVYKVVAAAWHAPAFRVPRELLR